MSVKKKEEAIYCYNCRKITLQTRIGKSKKAVQSDIAVGIATLGIATLFEAAEGTLGGPTYYECTKCGCINKD